MADFDNEGKYKSPPTAMGVSEQKANKMEKKKQYALAFSLVGTCEMKHVMLLGSLSIQ